MSKHYQESEIEFRLINESIDYSTKYPITRGIIIHQYGGNLEECIKKARGQFKLNESDWEVIRSERDKIREFVRND